MAAVAGLDGRGVVFVAITDNGSVEAASQEKRYRVIRTVRESPVHHFLVVRVHEPACEVDPIRHHVGSHEHRWFYCKKRTSQSNIVSAREIIAWVYLQFVGLAQLYERRIQVQCRKTHIPRPVLVVESATDVETAAVRLRRRESIVIGLFQVGLASIKTLAEHPQLCSHGQSSAEEPEPVGILQAESLVSEQTNLVVHQLQAHPVVRFQEIQRHVGRRIHRLRVVFKAHKVHGISPHDVQLRLLSHRSRVERRLHVEIVSEVHIVLCASPHSGKRTKDEYG